MGGNIPGGNFLGGNFARTFKLSLDQKTERNLLSLSRQTKKLRNLIFLIGFFGLMTFPFFNVIIR